MNAPATPVRTEAETAPYNHDDAVRLFAQELILSPERDGSAWLGFRTSPPCLRRAVLHVLTSLPRTPHLMKVIECAEWVDAWRARHGE